MILKKHLVRICLAMLLSLAACLPPFSGVALAAQTRFMTGVVTHVTDGDTLWVKTSTHGEPRKVRFSGIDAPESCQPGGAEATAALTSRVQFKTVQLRTRARDDYGRVLAVVTLDGSDVGQWMVANGYAWSYHSTRPRTGKSGLTGQSTYLGPYGVEETQARAAGRGLWSAAAGSPMEPRVFRKTHGACPRPVHPRPAAAKRARH